MPLLDDPGHREMVSCLHNIAQKLREPSAIIVVSAHWETKFATVTSGQSPQLIYDYYGFPEESYSIEYPCVGEPYLAQDIHSSLEQAGIETRLDGERGFDHGLFVPLKLMFPKANIPCVQLSLLDSLNPSEHIRIGHALQRLKYDNLLVIGSGFSFHNLKAFFTSETNESQILNESFESWLKDTCSNKSISEEVRKARLCEWSNAPGARFCHPREEHLLPLHVCYGLANKACSELFELEILRKKSSMYLW